MYKIKCHEGEILDEEDRVFSISEGIINPTEVLLSCSIAEL
jgi:hypothetical protein